MRVQWLKLRSWLRGKVLHIAQRRCCEHKSNSRYMRYGVYNDEAEAGLTDLSIDLELRSHRLAFGRDPSFRIELHMGEVVAIRRYLNTHMALKSERRHFYIVEADPLYCLLHHWVPKIGRMAPMQGRQGDDTSQPKLPYRNEGR